MTDNYNDELIKYAFTQGLYSLQVHGADSMNQAALLGLVSHIYIQFRKYSDSLMEILLQIPGISRADTDLLDKRVRAISDGTEQLTEKKRRDLFKKIVDIALTGTGHRRPVYLRPLPPIEKQKKAEPSPKYEAVSDLFAKA